MNSEQFHGLKNSRREEAQNEDTETLVNDLVGELENGTSMTQYNARALAIAYELHDRETE